ncbi:hypothetical protein PC111_g21302 [Phytophthora cactorum]|nr:hypothetical protein PC111_g21302 [Phytophthora cactorum]
MASSLYPPAIYSLRDDVIGGVVDRVAPHNSKMELRFLVDPALPHQLSSRSVTEMSSSNQKQFPPLMAMASENTTDLSFKPPKVFEHKLKRISASRREQCRINQARYRSRQRAREKFVISSIRQLKVDIRDLETRRQTIASRSRFPKSIWSVAIEYFRLFQHGQGAGTSGAEYSGRDESVGSTRLPQPRRFYLSLFRVLSLSLSVSGLVDPASLASRRRDLRLATYLGRLHGVQPCLIRKGFNKRQTRGSDEAAIVVDTTVQWRDALYDDSNDLVAYQVATKYTLFPVEVVRLRAVISDYALDTKQGFSLILQQQTPKYDYFSRRKFRWRAASGASSTMKLSSQRLPNLESLAYTATQRTEESTPYTTEMTPQSNARQMKLSASRRERCRINQARYRKRQRQHEEEIEKHISDLQEEIQELETQHQDMMRSAPQNKSMWVVGTEYFRLFRHGYMAPMVAPEPTLAEKPCSKLP